MATQKLPTPDELRQLVHYDPETGVMRWRTGASFSDSGRGYLQRSWNGTTLYAHRIAWAIYHGRWPAGQIDHINGNRTDNRIENLRCVSAQENGRNQKLRATNKTGHHGVSWWPSSALWRAQICRNGKTTHLGMFSTKEEAIAARAAAERVLGFHPNHGRPG